MAFPSQALEGGSSILGGLVSIWIVTCLSEEVSVQAKARDIATAYWAVIDQGNVHHGGEYAVFDPFGVV